MLTETEREAVPSEQRRLALANELIAVIGSNGRGFWRFNGVTAKIERADNGFLWWNDHYTRKRVYMHRPFLGRGFCGGGTLNTLAVRLRDFVKKGKPLVLPAPQHWGYSDEELKPVIAKVAEMNNAVSDHRAAHQSHTAVREAAKGEG